MSWLPHMIFHCHQRRDFITRDAKETKQVSMCVCNIMTVCVAFRTSEASLKFIKWDNGSLVCF